MYRPGRSVGWGIAIASLVLLVGASAWIFYSSSGPHVAKDYEDCAEDARANSTSKIEYTKLVILCSERFVGRRKSSGGYAYFDFMQDRTFNIAGPNPTEDERKQIDGSYLEFLGSQRREMFLSNLAKTQANQEYATFDRVGPPLSLAPKVPLPIKRPPIARSRSCDDGSLSCSLAKLSAAVRNAFASTGANRP
jgi:hypothetical protein